MHRWSTLRKLIWLSQVVSNGATWVWETITGLAPLSLTDAVAKAIKNLTRYGSCKQSSTPTPTNPVDIVCNNGAVKWDSTNERIYTDGTPEVITLGEQTASAVSLFQVGDYADTHDIISGAVNRKVGVLVLDGTETELWTIQSNRVYARMENIGITVKLGSDTIRLLCTHSSNTSVNTLGAVFIFFTTADYNISTAADWNAFLAAQYAAGTPVIVLYPLSDEISESVSPQHLETADGTNTILVTANISDTTLEVVYAKQSV